MNLTWTIKTKFQKKDWLNTCDVIIKAIFEINISTVFSWSSHNWKENRNSRKKWPVEQCCSAKNFDCLRLCVKKVCVFCLFNFLFFSIQKFIMNQNICKFLWDKPGHVFTFMALYVFPSGVCISLFKKK